MDVFTVLHHDLFRIMKYKQWGKTREINEINVHSSSLSSDEAICSIFFDRSPLFKDQFSSLDEMQEIRLVRLMRD